MSEYREMPSYEIAKVKLKSGKLEVEYTELYHDSNFKNEVAKKCDNYIHQDLTYAMDMLKMHLVAICEMPEAIHVFIDNISSDSLLEELTSYIITGYTKGGNGEGAGVCITGQRILRSGKILNLVTPFTKFFSEDGEDYFYCEQLFKAIQRLDYEVDAYLFGEKWGMKQLSLDFDEAGTDSKPEEPKKRGRKKKAKAEEFTGYEEVGEELAS